MLRAAARPPCIATCATPGSGVPVWWGKEARSPMTNTSGCPGMERSGSTSTRPIRSVGTPSPLPSGDAATPAAHTTG